jgi:hypothetical protein
VRAAVIVERAAAGFFSIFQSGFAMGSLAGVYPMIDAPNEARDWRCYEPQASDSVQALAQAAGRDPEEFLYDFMLEQDGKAALNYPIMNYSDGNLDGERAMMVRLGPARMVFSIRGAESLSESCMKWMSGGAKRQRER